MVRYLYIDDDELLHSRDKVSGFAAEGKLEILVENNKVDWNQQIARLKAVDFNGLILDLKLDEIPVEDGRHSEFRGTSLSQQIRDLQKDGTIPSFPIILFSSEEKIKSSLDDTGRDLFDLCIEKQSINVRTMLSLPSRLVELSELYKQLDQKGEVKMLLQVPERVDERFLGTLENLQKNSSIAVCAHFLLHEFIQTPGLLVNKELLAARLGIDMENTPQEIWMGVESIFEKVLYRGVLGKGWKRWWMRGINDMWHDFSGGEYLQMMTAQERVDVLRKLLNTDAIIPAKRLRYCESDKFWAVCYGTGRPIDPVDGFVIDGQELHYPWQDYRYVSKLAAFHKTNPDRWKNVAPSEKQRLEILKQEYQREQI